jgi:hypothetical protein
VLTGIFDGLCLLMPNCDWCCRTEIEWIPGKNLTTKVLKKKPKNGAKNTKPVTKTERCESFFNFFNPPQVPDDEDIDQDMVQRLSFSSCQRSMLSSSGCVKLLLNRTHAKTFDGQFIQDCLFRGDH